MLLLSLCRYSHPRLQGFAVGHSSRLLHIQPPCASPSTPVKAWQRTGLHWSGAEGDKVNRRDKKPGAALDKCRKAKGLRELFPQGLLPSYSATVSFPGMVTSEEVP